MRKINLLTISCITLILTVTYGIHAREFTEKDHPDSLLNFETVFKSASQVTGKTYPDADDVLVDDYVYVTYNADGTSVTTDDTYFKVLTEKGKRGSKALTRHFNKVYSTVTYKLVEVIKPDGTRKTIDIKKNSSIAVSRGQMSMNIYDPNQKVLTVSIPELEINDTIHYVVRYKTLKARVRNTWADIQVFEYTSPIKHYVYEVAGPKERPLKSIALKNPVPGKITSSTKKLKDTIVYRWEVKDMPRMFREPQMPSLHTVVTRLLVSTAASWEDISRWYYSISKPHLIKTTDAMKKKTQELIKGKKSRQEKIEAVFYYVSQQVRYMGLTLEQESPGYEPHDVSMTFDRKYGVCRDKAALLATMLNLAGIEAYPVLIHAGPKKDKEVPLPYFNHAITGAVDEKGGYILMDSTSDTAKDLFPAHLSDSSFLVATPKGDPLRVSSIAPASENMLQIKTQASLAKTGSLEGKTEILFGGINDGMYRRFLINSNPERRKRLFEGIVQDMAPGATVKSITLTPDNFMDMNTPLKALISFTAPDVISAGTSYSFLKVPLAGARIGAVNFIIRNTGLAKRKYPFRTRFACGVKETLSIDLGTGVGETVSLPTIVAVNKAGVVFDRKFTRKNNELKVTSQFSLNTVEFSPDEYLILKNSLKDIEYASRKKPIFKTTKTKEALPAYKGSDALILEDSVTFTIRNKHEWTERVKHRKQALTHLGKKWYAELKINYNTGWDEFKLISASVTHTNGTVRHVKPEEINVMDARWASRAPRYPKSVTRVISFPGVSIGSIIAYEYEITRTKRPFFCTIQKLQEEEPVVRKSVAIIHPENIPLTIESTYKIPPQNITKNNGMVTRTWIADNIDRIKGEPDRPPLWMLVPSLIVSAGNWEEYRKTVLQAFSEKMTVSPEIKEQVQKLKLANTGDDRKTIRTIRDLVMKSIRTDGPSFTGAPLSSLTSAKTTLAEGYGSRADIILVLTALLKAAGYNPEIVLATKQAPFSDKYTSLLNVPPNYQGIFNRPLVRVKLDTWIYLGDTGQYAQVGSTKLEGHSAIRLTGDIKPFSIQIPQKSMSRTETVYNVDLDENGDAEITYTKTYYGTAFSLINMLNRELTPENRMRHYKGILVRISQSAEPLTKWQVNSDTYPATETFKVKVPRFAVRDGNRLYCTLPESLNSLYNTSEKHRVYPYRQSRNTDRTIRTEIKTPKGWIPSMVPPGLSWNQPDFSGTVYAKTVIEDDKIVITQKADLDPVLIRTGDYMSIREIEQTLKHPKSHTIMMVKE
ncbi:DUF3857 domain-containing protein [Planctomycetota bacterium]